MPAARAWALTLLLSSQKTGRFPDRVLFDLLEKHPEISGLDRAFIQQLIYGVNRWRNKIDWALERHCHSPLSHLSFRTLSILRLGAFQLLFLDRIPPSAAVNEAVKLAGGKSSPRTAGLVNAVLRSLERNRGSLIFPTAEDPLSYLTVTLSHPAWLAEYWLKTLPPGEAARLCEANNRIPPLALRVNTLKADRATLLARLQDLADRVEPASFSPTGIRVVQPRQPLTASPLFTEGLFQIQDEASQMIALILAPRPGEQVLDLGAGFGGKATHLGQLMENRGRIVAIDLQVRQIRALTANARRLGVDIIEGRQGDLLAGEAFRYGGRKGFDRILLDAPCSGWGVIRRNPDLKWRIRHEDSPRLAEQQIKFLQKAAGWLKPRGVLVYATCTLCPEENERVVERFLSGHPEFALEPVQDYLPETARVLADPRGYFYAWPQRHGTDGFFAARLVRA